MKKFSNVSENIKEQNKNQKLVEALGTLLHSWGSDTPDEVFWGLNEVIEWINESYNAGLKQFGEDDDYEGVQEELEKFILSNG